MGFCAGISQTKSPVAGSDKALRFSGSKNLKRQGTYHYVLGLNTSAPGPVAAYFNSLSSLLQRNEQSSGWFSRNTKWSVAGALFCSWNAFRQEDVYIEMQIPGGVNAFFLDGANQRYAVLLSRAHTQHKTKDMYSDPVCRWINNGGTRSMCLVCCEPSVPPLSAFLA